MISDIQLIELLYNNPEEGLKIMMDNYVGLVYTIIYNKLNTIYKKEDIEECVSDVFFEVFNYKDKIDLEKGSIKTLISIMAKRKAIDLYRRHRDKNFEISIDALDTKALPSIDNIEASIDKKETSIILINTIKSLGPPDSEIMIRKYYLQQSSKDISKILGIKVNTIDKKASRCIAKLRQALGGIF